jgi:hypothetical protein
MVVWRKAPTTTPWRLLLGDALVSRFVGANGEVAKSADDHLWRRQGW